MTNRVSFVEMKVRVKEFKEKILSIKNQEIKIWYEPKLLNRIPFMGSNQYSNLMYFLGIFERTLNGNNDLKKFKYRLWNMSLRDDKKLIFYSTNKHLKEEVFLNIDLETRKSFVLTKEIYKNSI